MNPQLGLTEKDLLGKTEYEVLAKEDADRLTAIKRQVLESGKSVHMAFPLVARNGNTEYMDGSYVPTRSADGTVNGIIGYFRNMTEAMRLERALRDSENSYRRLVEQASEAIFITDDKGNYVEANARACAMVGYAREEILRLNLKDIILPEDVEATPMRFADLEAGKQVLIERQLRRKDGSVFFAEISGTLLTDHRFQGIVRDISERKRMQASLRQSEEKYRHLFNNAEVGMFRTRIDGTEILDFNDKYREIYGRTR
jgi:PAS domain S-box-containing protein